MPSQGNRAMQLFFLRPPTLIVICFSLRKAIAVTAQALTKSRLNVQLKMNNKKTVLLQR